MSIGERERVWVWVYGLAWPMCVGWGESDGLVVLFCELGDVGAEFLSRGPKSMANN